MNNEQIRKIRFDAECRTRQTYDMERSVCEEFELSLPIGFKGELEPEWIHVINKIHFPESMLSDASLCLIFQGDYKKEIHPSFHYVCRTVSLGRPLVVWPSLAIFSVIVKSYGELALIRDPVGISGQKLYYPDLLPEGN